MTASCAGVGRASPVFSTVTVAAISATVGPVLAGRNVTFNAWSALTVPSVARSVGANARSSPSVPFASGGFGCAVGTSASTRSEP